MSNRKTAFLLALLMALAFVLTACEQRAPQTQEPVSAAVEPEPPQRADDSQPQEEEPAQPQEEEQPAQPGEEAPDLEPAPQETAQETPETPEETATAPEATSETQGEPGEAVVPVPKEAEDKNYRTTPREIATLAGSALADFDLTISQEFKVTRPEKNISTTLDTYYIMGTSNPSAPLYHAGEEVERPGTKGTWGVHVKLSMGANTFTFTQGGKTASVTITRTAVPGTAPISVITQKSMWPAVQGGVKAGEMLAVECVAPSGAAVTATFEGKTVALQQAANANAGIPAVFRGEIQVGTGYSAGVTTKVGKVQYRLTYGGKVTDYESTGDVYVAGSGGHIAVRVTAYQGFVYDDISKLSEFREKLKTGATDYVYSEDNEYFRLYSGGYVPKEQCQIIEGEVKIGNKISSVSASVSGKREKYTFHGIGTPAYRAYYGEGDTFVFIVYNTNGAQPVDVSGSKLFSSAKATQNDNSSVTYVFTFKNTALYWGYNVQFSGTDLVLNLSHKPALSGGARPLSGMKIVLDPGHGDNDTGALGFTGTDGPTENMLNLANALVLKDKLESMGATVILTRTKLDEYLTLDQRLQVHEKNDADLFLSMHHNSLGVGSDGNKVSGTEIYYHTPHSKGTATRIIDKVTATLGRENRGARQSYYRVTLLPASPSMLIEIGYLCNPVEYENCCNAATIQKTAQGIADGIVAALS